MQTISVIICCLFAVTFAVDIDSNVGLKAASRNANCGCQCSSLTFKDKYGNTQGNCRSTDRTGAQWCYVESSYSTCSDLRSSTRFSNQWSYEACSTPERTSYECQNNGYNNGNNGNNGSPCRGSNCGYNNGYNTGSNGYNTGSNGYNTGSNNYNSGSNGYNTGSNGYNTGSSGYNTGSNGYNTGSNGYNTGSNGYNTGSSGYNTGSSLGSILVGGSNGYPVRSPSSSSTRSGPSVTFKKESGTKGAVNFEQ